MHFTWLPRYHPHVVASEMQPRRFWLHAFMVLGIVGVLALPPVRAWTRIQPWFCLGLVLVHLACFGAEVYLGLYRRWPTLWSTVYVTWNLVSAVAIAILPGRMILPLWSLYGIHVLYLTRAVTISPYLIALIVSAPLFAGWAWQLSGSGAFAHAWPQLALVSMSGGALYLTLAPSIEHQRRIQAELDAARERERVAADLHDTVGSALAEVALWQEMAIAERGDGAGEAWERARARTSEALLELRTAVSAMTARDVEATELGALLRARVRAICEAGRAELRLDIEASSVKLPGEMAHQISNLVTEAVNNAVRHGRPKVVDVELRFSPFFFRARDDGRGFDSKTARRGQGLASMEARASWLGATLTITSSPSSGTTVEVRGRRELVT